MMTPDQERVIQQLVNSGVITPDDGQIAMIKAAELAERGEDDSITSYLSAQGKLTDFQVAVIQEGKTKELVIGNYTILDRLGAGGMGTVFKARHRRMKRIVAVKVLSASLTQNETFVQRFQREVEAIARLSHPNIMLAYDADESDVGHFLVMEYIDGEDLADIVKKQGPMKVREAVDCVSQAARAMEYAHGRGIVHRDIKPANLMRDKSGTVKVMDLGLARFTDVLAGPSQNREVTQEGTIAGTVDFMAPEQALDTRLADHRADIYSLGCTLYFLLTGQYLHDGKTVLERILAHREQSARPISQIRKDVPPSLDAVFLKMVATKLPDRYQSMNEVLRDLEACTITDQPVEFVTGFASTSVALAPTSDECVPGITICELTVLIVEPSRTQSSVMASLLNKLGTRRVQSARSGQEAIAALRASRHDLVISAMHLPDMTGLDLLDQMRGEGGLSQASFILVSGEGDCAFLDSLGSNARVAVLPKPFDAPLLSWAMTVAVEGLITQSMMLPKINVGNARVLLVDDSVVARAHLRKTLEAAGLRHITEATNGRQARDLLETNTFDLVVADYNMPEMDGEGLLRYIRWQSSQRSISVIMVTAETDEARRASLRHLGVFALSGKNLDPKLVHAALAGSLAL